MLACLRRALPPLAGVGPALPVYAGNLRLCDFGWSIEVADYDTRQTICGTQVGLGFASDWIGSFGSSVFFRCFRQFSDSCLMTYYIDVSQQVYLFLVLYDTYDLYDLGRVDGWESYNLDDLRHISWVRYVLYI